MKELRYTINDLLEQLRVMGWPNVQDVEFGVLETNGQLSVVPKSQKRPVNPEDLGLETKYEGLPTPLVVDGQVDVQNLRRIGLDEQWLRASWPVSAPAAPGTCCTRRWTRRGGCSASSRRRRKTERRRHEALYERFRLLRFVDSDGAAAPPACTGLSAPRNRWLMR